MIDRTIVLTKSPRLDQDHNPSVLAVVDSVVVEVLLLHNKSDLVADASVIVSNEHLNKMSC